MDCFASAGAHSRDPLARNDGVSCLKIESEARPQLSLPSIAVRRTASLPLACDRATQYSRGISIESSSRGVLDIPAGACHRARRRRDMTTVLNRRRLPDPGDKPDDHENANRQRGGERTGRHNPHRNLKEAEIVIHVGGMIFSVSQLTSTEQRGSETTLVSMKSHFGHSKVRFSVRPGRGTMLVRFIRARHLTQRGRSIGESKTSVSERGMSLTRRLMKPRLGAAFSLSGR
jgi:hypothetical protein